MRPAHKSISAGVLEVREQVVSHFEAALFESIRTWFFDRYRFAEAHPIRSFFFIPKRGKVYLYVNETLCWKPGFPNHQ